MPLDFRVALRVVALSVPLGLAAGCGSPTSQPGPLTAVPGPIFSRAGTSACLLARGVRIGGRLDFLASSATGGAFVAHLGGNVVTVAFGETTADSQSLEAAYRRFASPRMRPRLAVLLRRYDNVVTVWNDTPRTTSVDLVAGCLRLR